MSGPKRLIEIDLPIRRISAHARREKSIRHGHISTLHIWWARRPLAACRAVLCAALWPDPVDENCPDAFRKTARTWMEKWAAQYVHLLSGESQKRFFEIQKKSIILNDNQNIRGALLDFIADFANWDNSNVPEFLETSRSLTQAAHEAFGGLPTTHPLVVDPFSGGGAIPLEALRVGADAFASDLNPVAVLLNKVLLEYVPKYGKRLANDLKKSGELIRKEAKKELGRFYPEEADGAIPVAYLWARQINCEGPNCGTQIPLIRSTCIAVRDDQSIFLRITPLDKKRGVQVEIVRGASANGSAISLGTIRKGAVTCPCCNFTTTVASVRKQMEKCNGGSESARLLAVVTCQSSQGGRFYRQPTASDLEAFQLAIKELSLRLGRATHSISLIPDEIIDTQHHDVNRAPLYGMKTWGSLFSPRQALANSTIAKIVEKTCDKIQCDEPQYCRALKTLLSFAVDRLVDYNSSFVRWVSRGEFLGDTFSRQALSFITDFAEVYPFSDTTGGWSGAIEWICKCIEALIPLELREGRIESFSAVSHMLPNDFANAFITDPPYYDSINYAMLSDFFYVWLRRLLLNDYPDLFQSVTTNKADECVLNPVRDKDATRYQQLMQASMAEGRRILHHSGIGVIIFAHKSTSGWESQLGAMIDGGWKITASWPIDSEMTARVAAKGQARLASSIHLVCRPRPENGLIGDWRDVLAELPKRIHEWMPRLANEGIVGADAIFACLGPALEIYSRYSHVEKASGEEVPLKEYLEHVWAAVAKEALGMIFQNADATGFEEDARLTAMWLWTVSTAKNGIAEKDNESSESDEEEESASKSAKNSGVTLEYDAARKIAQGLGIHLAQMANVVEVKGDKARLLSVAERSQSLMTATGVSLPIKRKKKAEQVTMSEILGEPAPEEKSAVATATKEFKPGNTLLDRVHQSMLLFASGRGEALKRFLIEDAVGTDTKFWSLAQALSALYPKASEEKRWVDGVLARKKGLGF